MCSGARGDQKKHRILWNWRYRGCELPGEWWELNVGALQEPRVFLATGPSLQVLCNYDYLQTPTTSTFLGVLSFSL